jgi:hypothetical protein
MFILADGRWTSKGDTSRKQQVGPLTGIFGALQRAAQTSNLKHFALDALNVSRLWHTSLA